MQRDLFPIARGGGGQNICIGIRKSNYGKIFQWDSNQENNTDYSPRKLADSFPDFLETLKEIT
ncbi:MAG: SMI1/KNR4 family protein [Pseudomonadales bacterium]|nr:SMI1/KNR4 family protein [Pseudomonadales bacterium]